MNLLLNRKSTTKKVRDIVHDERALKKAAKASIKDQKQIHRQAVRLRAQTAR